MKIVFIMTRIEQTNRVVIALMGVILKERCRGMIDKAIKFFENEIRSLELAPELNGCEMTEEWKEQMEIFKTSKSALEKQIPKKPNIHGYREGREINTISYTCPVCNKHISRDNYCKNCGNAIDWSDTE